MLHTPMHSVGITYTRAIQQAGGTPLIIPPLTQSDDWPGLLAHLDGLLLSGGEDIAPSHYGQELEPWTGRVDEERDCAELGLLRAWLPLGKPLLAICRGHQVLNIALGGTLLQDIATRLPDALDHAYTPARPMERDVHTVDLVEGSRLAHILGGTHFAVNSAHHQAVTEPGRGVSIVARAPDGIIEATEIAEHPFCISVQWHPEAMLKTSDTMRPLFAAFADAAR
ncbi:MAG: gamma-glutamyl-gamma-aminobutyrate hydrolase family protein [Anaerolineae bacterium]|nr:gamma-glutamyl-gamma-aminobutyrate hydrolase family protein [Anaerolineae bacterium]